MAAEPLILNPIGWVQLQLLGGWRRQLGICGAYAGAVLLFCVLIFRSVRDSVSVASFCGSACMVLNIIEAAILFLIGTGAVKRAVQRDFTTDMITSHRLTAMSGSTAVLGYLTGATAQVIAVTLTTWLICTVLALTSNMPKLQAHFAPTVLLAMAGSLAILCWTFAVLVALSTRGKVAITGLLIVLGMLANAGVVHILPGLALLVPATIILNMRTTSLASLEPATFVLSILAQLSLSLSFFLGASRKFLRDDVPAFGGALGYCLLALCSLLGAVGIGFLPMSTSGLTLPIFADPAIQLVATLTALALVGIVPISEASRAAERWLQHSIKDPHHPMTRPRSYLWAPVLSSAIVLSVLALVLMPQRDRVLPLAPNGLRMALAAAIFVLSQITISGLLRFSYQLTPRAMWIVILYLVIFWAIPPFADLSWEVVMDRDPTEGRTILFTASPVGAWIVCCTTMPAPTVAGVAVQAMVAAGAITHSARRKRPGPIK